MGFASVVLIQPRSALGYRYPRRRNSLAARWFTRIPKFYRSVHQCVGWNSPRKPRYPLESSISHDFARQRVRESDTRLILSTRKIYVYSFQAWKLIFNGLNKRQVVAEPCSVKRRAPFSSGKTRFFSLRATPDEGIPRQKGTFIGRANKSSFLAVFRAEASSRCQPSRGFHAILTQERNKGNGKIRFARLFHAGVFASARPVNDMN